MFAAVWKLLKDTVAGFIEDGALSHGAAMAFYAATSLAPILLIVIAVAGLAFGREAAQNALEAQLTGLMGQESASNRNPNAATSPRLAARARTRRDIVLPAGLAFQITFKDDCISPNTPEAVTSKVMMVSLVMSAAITTLGHYCSLQSTKFYRTVPSNGAMSGSARR